MWLRAQRERATAEVRDAFAERFAQTPVDCRGQRRKVLLSFGERGFGGGAAPVAVLCRLGDGFEVALQRAGVGGRDQALAGAPAGDEQGGGGAEQPGAKESDQTIHVH
jgi:hypothetical protein